MESKYLEILDEEVLEFIRRTEAFYPPNAIDCSTETQRKFYDALCKEFEGDWPEGVRKHNRWITTREHNVLVREYTKENCDEAARILYFHGGGFVVGSLESHDSICAEFCARTGTPVIAVDYRLCPEFLHPAAFEDCLNVYRRLEAENPVPTILAGDSAGGTLAAAVASAVKDNSNCLSGQLLIYPALGSDRTSSSYVNHRSAPMLTLADVEYYEQIRGGGRNLAIDHTATPLAADDFSGLPPTVIIAADCDPLADDGEFYMQALNQAGAKAHFINEAGLVHGYLRARAHSNRAAESFTTMVGVFNMLAAGNWDF